MLTRESSWSMTTSIHLGVPSIILEGLTPIFGSLTYILLVCLLLRKGFRFVSRFFVSSFTNALFLLFIDSSEYQDIYIEFGVFLLNSSQHTLNISIPIINISPTGVLHVSLRLLSDDFSCATIEPSTADIHILDDDDIDIDGSGGG